MHLWNLGDNVEKQLSIMGSVPSCGSKTAQINTIISIWLFSLAGVIGVFIESENSLIHQLFSVRVSTHYVYDYLFKTDPQHESTFGYRLPRLSLCMPSPGRISDRARASLRFTNAFL